MKSIKVQKVISIICSILGFILSLYGLTIGLQSLDSEGFGRLGIIFIQPSIITLLIIVLDFLITVGIIKKGLIYSCIISLIKIGIIMFFIINRIKYGMSYVGFTLTVIASFIIVTIPSVFNTIRLFILRKNNK